MLFTSTYADFTIAWVAWVTSTQVATGVSGVGRTLGIGITVVQYVTTLGFTTASITYNTITILLNAFNLIDL